MIDVALVGCGAVAEIVATRIYRTPGLDSLRIIAAVDPDHDRADRIAELTGAQAYPDLRTAAKHRHLDAVDIRTPHHTHVELALQALDLGLHVLVEKPAATSTAEAAVLRSAAERSRQSVSVSENYGLLAPVRRAAEAVESGTIGAAVSVRATRAFKIAPPWVKDWRLDADTAGGGVIVDQGVHQVRMLREVVGEIESVQAAADADAVLGSAADTCAVNLRFVSGVVGQMLLTWATDTPAAGPELQVFTTGGSIDVHVSYDSPGGGCFIWRAGDPAAEMQAGGVDYYDSLDAVVRHWGEILERGAPSRIGLDDALHDLAVCDAIVASLRSGGSSQRVTGIESAAGVR